MIGTKISAIEYYLPKKIKNNKNLKKDNPKININRIKEKTGINNRYISEKNETVIDISAKAASKIFKKYSKHKIDLIILVTQTTPYRIPTTACILQNKLGLRKDTIAFDINLEDALKVGKSVSKDNERQKIKILGDAIEALIGAIYLDKGYTIVEKTILNLWEDHIEKSVVTEIDAKTKLQELTLKNFKKLPTYKLISNTGPRHKPIFKVGVKLPNTKYFIASGKSKKEAEQNAAIECLKITNKK